MINLLAVYCENIGPFNDICCSLIFDRGKYLIKAPIGSGKSFLFFDAPRYALYKDSSRNMLNLQSKSGEISLIFEVNDCYYLVKRMLTHNASGNDKCESSFYTVGYEGKDLLEDIKNLSSENGVLQWGVNIIQKFESENGKLRDLVSVPFKNESDLKSLMDEFLPPKEVFLSTVFLLQDADNIFEMRPADRLIVLKNVFDLLGIDDAKEKVQEKKREVGYKLKALQDHSFQDGKLRANLRSLWDNIKTLKEDDELRNILSANDDFFINIEGFFDKISLNDFTLNGMDYSPFEKVENLIKTKMDTVIKLDAQLSGFQQQVSSLNQKKSQISKDIQAAKDDISKLQKKIENIDAKKGKELEDKLSELDKKLRSLTENAEYSDFDEIIEFWNDKAKDFVEDFKILELPKDLESAYNNILKPIIDVGKKELRYSIDSINSDLKYIDLQAKNWKTNHDNEVEKMKELKSRKEDEIKQQQIKIEEHDKMWAEKPDFYCPDLCKNCPHINAINKQQYDQYIKQKEKLEHELKNMKSEYEKQDFDNKIKELENQKNPEGEDKKKDLEKKLKELTDFSDTLRNHLMKLEFSKWESAYNEWKGVEKERNSVDAQLSQRKAESNKLEEYQQGIVAAQTSLKNYDKFSQENDKQIEELNVKIDGVKSEKEKYNSPKLQQQQNDIKQISQTISQIEQLIKENVENKNLTKKLQEDEKKLSRLYSIFSKELILSVLNTRLPLLCDVINDYLSQCVDYTLKMQIDESAEKLELDVSVIDGKGEREVKSLSGGQRTVLKLVWMLAVSSYLRTPLLFLDETINNLDADTVGRVSEMINNFVKQRTMKFYTVTHNKEIQDMQIWDDIIEVNGAKEVE